jgi:TRAP-type C4-dicarboxylate transport system permease small subunit
MTNQLAATGLGPRIARRVVGVSEGALSLEKLAVGGLMTLLVALILLNVVTRYTGAPLYWVDEASVYTMVWLTFIGGSALTRLRLDFAMTLLTERLSPRAARFLQIVATLFVLLFALALAWMCAVWLDPIGIAGAGFDAKAYAGKSFNFLYTEHTQTLGWPTWVVYLVIPLFALTMTLHSLANLAEDLGLSERRARPEFKSAEGVN